MCVCKFVVMRISVLTADTVIVDSVMKTGACQRTSEIHSIMIIIIRMYCVVQEHILHTYHFQSSQRKFHARRLVDNIFLALKKNSHANFYFVITAIEIFRAIFCLDHSWVIWMLVDSMIFGSFLFRLTPFGGQNEATFYQM